MKQEISRSLMPCTGKVHKLISSVSCKMYDRLFHEAGTLKDCLTFRQVHQSFFYASCMSRTYSITSSSPGKSSFLPKCLTNSIRSLFDAHHPLEVDWRCQKKMLLIAMKSPKFLKHFKCHSLLAFERFKDYLLE